MTYQDPRASSPNPHRLYRIPERGKMFGVCAGLADYFGAEVGLVRLAAAVALIFFFVPTLAGYWLPEAPQQVFLKPFSGFCV